MVDLRVYHLDEDPTPGYKYGDIAWSTVVIDGRLKVTKMTREALTRGLRWAVEQRKPTRDLWLPGALDKAP